MYSRPTTGPAQARHAIFGDGEWERRDYENFFGEDLGKSYPETGSVDDWQLPKPAPGIAEPTGEAGTDGAPMTADP